MPIQMQQGFRNRLPFVLNEIYRQVLRSENTAICYIYAIFDDILQLADIAGPIIRLEELHNFIINS